MRAFWGPESATLPREKEGRPWFHDKLISGGAPLGLAGSGSGQARAMRRLTADIMLSADSLLADMIIDSS